VHVHYLKIRIIMETHYLLTADDSGQITLTREV
jgi:hypothetical protein